MRLIGKNWPPQQNMDINIYYIKKIQSSFTLQQNEREMIKRMSNLHFNAYSYLMIKHLMSKTGFNRHLFKIIVKKYPFDTLSIPFRFIRGVLNKQSIGL